MRILKNIDHSVSVTTSTPTSSLKSCIVVEYGQAIIYFFSIGREAWGNTLVDAEKTSKSVRVPCYPFYSVLAALGNPVVDYMSLDVEGVELKVQTCRYTKDLVKSMIVII
jgi:hypothetical protein